MTRKAHPKDFHGYFVNYCKMVDLVRLLRVHSPGAERNIEHIYERMLRFYPIFARQEDPCAWFVDEEERRAYDLFRYTQQYEPYCVERVRTCMGGVPENCRVWIYGAGALGRAAWKGLMNAGYVIRGFLVTDMKGNPSALLGHEVRSIETVQPEENAVVVIAASDAYREEIIPIVEGHGWNYRIYTGGR
jgi:hypothetical protein